ncbi:MAG: DUF222 domain-containing protein [Actinobacteria bacterium]|nr:DUF222 domain-containing protein [Actinomycetota bacterium]
MDTLVVEPGVSPGVLEAVPLERIEAEITELAAHLAAAEARWLALIGEFDRREGYAVWGCRSTAVWLNWRCGLSMPAAHERVRVARALSDLPVTRAAFFSGELSYSKVRAITRVATAESESDLVDVARASTAAQLERITKGVAAVERTLREEARRHHHERALSVIEHDDGSGTIVVHLPPERLALARAALESVAETMAIADFVSEIDSSAEDATDTPSDPWSARMVDAFCRLAEMALDSSAEERSFSERFLVNVHLDLRALLEDEDEAGCLGNGTALSSETLDRLLCDGSCVPVIQIDGVPVHSGEKAPAIPRAMRRALRARDQGCRFPGCTNTKWVDAHHVIWRSRGGPTELWNLLELCRFHHTSVHARGFVAERRDDEFVFFRPDGTPVPPVCEPARAEGRSISERNLELGLDIHPETIVSRWDGSVLDRFGLSGAVDSLLRLRGVDLR